MLPWRALQYGDAKCKRLQKLFNSQGSSLERDQMAYAVNIVNLVLSVIQYQIPGKGSNRN
jgi:hypothetical protein